MNQTPIYEQLRTALAVDPERADWPNAELPRFRVDPDEVDQEKSEQDEARRGAKPDDPVWPSDGSA